jgi:spermidine/putrescine transport system permease protein
MTLRRLMPRWAMAGPSLLWWSFFFVVPLGWIAVYSLGTKPATPGAGPVSLEVLSLDNYAAAGSGVFLVVFWITMRTAVLGTIACALVGFPVAYALANLVPPRWRSVLLFLLVLPYWTSFLLRTFAWRIVLAPEGALSGALQSLGIIDGRLAILDSNAAVQLGIVYNYLPLMILPLYAALERMDWSLVDAAQDLGDTPLRAFRRVTLPLVLPGVIVGCLLVFIPLTGEYLIPVILGGDLTVYAGNLIGQQFLTARDWPFGAAIAMVVIGAMTAAIILFTRVAAKAEQYGG